jgi:plasmid stabilization system protein ParE
MSLPVVLLASAEADLADAREWYRQNGPDLENEFAASVHETLERIRLNPTAYESEGPFRRAFLHRFPYRIVYRATAAQIAVVAVLHTGRDPRVWQDRDH